MSRRLTNAIKDSFKHQVMTRTFDERKEALMKLQHTAAEYAYAALIPADQQELMKRLPEDFFSYHSTVRITTKQCNTTGLRSDCHELHLANELMFPHPYRFAHKEVVLSEAGVAALNKYHETRMKLANDQGQLDAKLTTLLAAVNTDKALLEAWPESVNYFQESWFPPSRQALAIPAAEINAQIACSIAGTCA